MAFLRNLLATLVGLFLFFFVGFFIFAGVIATLGQEEVPIVKNNSILSLKLSGVVQERTVDDPLQELFPNSAPLPIGLIDVVNSIKSAKTDDKIIGIYLEPQFLLSGYGSLEEIREALIDFKTSGKFFFAYSEYLSENDYYLANVADSILVNPEGALEFNGLSINVTFWKGLFDKLDIQPEIFRVGQFKSFVEPFQQKQMSEANRLQLTELLNSIYDHQLANTSSVRDISGSLRQLSDEMTVQIPIDGVNYGLIDGLVYEDEIKEVMAKKSGVESISDINFISFRDYKKTISDPNTSSNRIAVIFAEGEIVMGGDETTIVGEQLANEIRKARENKSIKAIVLRVNSPGGSLTASDMIWREVVKTKGVKPIVASMSDVAASGGYYISMACDSIVAQPTTITGSIGIFGLLFNLDNFLDNKLGITNEAVGTGEFSDFVSLTRPLTDFERSVIQKTVEKGYTTFITKVSESRSIPLEDVKEIAEGRVWSGVQAKEIKLVDRLGDLEDAIEIAAKLADIEGDYRLRYYPRQKPLLEKLLEQSTSTVKSYVLADQPQFIKKYTEKIDKLNNLNGIQARLPWLIEMN